MLDISFVELLVTARLRARDPSYALHADHIIEVLRPASIAYASGVIASVRWDAETDATAYLLVETYNTSVSRIATTMGSHVQFQLGSSRKAYLLACD